MNRFLIWRSVKVAQPPSNVVLRTKIDDERGVRNEAKLIFSNNLWWFEDKSMYVYYEPTHWSY